MKQYDVLDNELIAAIRSGNNPLYSVYEESSRLAELTGRYRYRIIDGRLQALRKQGWIEYKDHKWSIVNV